MPGKSIWLNLIFIHLMEALLSIFEAKVPFSPQAREALLEAWKHRKALKRGENLIEIGKVEDQLYWVESGTLRIFFPFNGEEVCVGFGYPNTFLVSYPSFIKNEHSEYVIQAIRKSTLLGISRKDFYACLDRFPEIERAWRMLTEEALLGKIEREVEKLTFSPQQRLERLLSRSPRLFQLIPKKYIASYLRMKPETLSRMKF